MTILRSVVRVLGLLLALCGTVLAAQPSNVERLAGWISEGRFKAAVAELQQISTQSATLKRPKPTEEEALRGAIKTARSFLRENHPLEQRDTARQALCLARAYFPEELPGTGEPLRSLGSGYPRMLGKVTARRTELARRAGLQGTVILEVVVDSEGCVRSPRILKGLPFGLNEAAVAAVRSWAFEPARFQGRPVAVYYVIPVSFRAKE